MRERSAVENAAHGGRDVGGLRDDPLLERLVVGHRQVFGADPLHGRVELVERVLLHAIDHLGADAVTDVLVTHGHPDHVGGCVAFPHARVHVLEADVAIAEGREAAHSPIGSMMGAQATGVHVTDPARDGDVIALDTGSTTGFVAQALR